MAPDRKFVPVRDVMEIVVPAVPASGTIFLNVGFPAGETVEVVVVVAAPDVVDATAVVAAVVGCRIGMEVRGLLVIFSVYRFSMTILFACSVLFWYRAGNPKSRLYFDRQRLVRTSLWRDHSL